MKRTPTMRTPSEPFAVVAAVRLEPPDVEAATRYDRSPALKVGGAFAEYRIIDGHLDHEPPDFSPHRGVRGAVIPYVHLRAINSRCPRRIVSAVTNDATLRENSTSQALTEDGETPPFVVTQLQSSTVQLSLENPVLLAQEFDPSRCSRSSHPNSVATTMQRNHCASLRQRLVDEWDRHLLTG